MGAAVRALRETLGHEAMADLQTVVEDACRQAKDEMILVAGERFERRLGEEIGALRIDMAKEFADVRVELATFRSDVKGEFATIRSDFKAELTTFRSEVKAEFATIRSDFKAELVTVRSDFKAELVTVRSDVKAELALTRTEVLKWSFLFWIGQVAAVGAVMAFLLRTIGQHAAN
jgi:hypothetical protein